MTAHIKEVMKTYKGHEVSFFAAQRNLGNHVYSGGTSPTDDEHILITRIPLELTIRKQ